MRAVLIVGLAIVLMAACNQPEPPPGSDTPGLSSQPEPLVLSPEPEPIPPTPSPTPEPTPSPTPVTKTGCEDCCGWPFYWDQPGRTELEGDMDSADLIVTGVLVAATSTAIQFGGSPDYKTAIRFTVKTGRTIKGEFGYAETIQFVSKYCDEENYLAHPTAEAAIALMQSILEARPLALTFDAGRKRVFLLWETDYGYDGGPLFIRDVNLTATRYMYDLDTFGTHFHYYNDETGERDHMELDDLEERFSKRLQPTPTPLPTPMAGLPDLIVDWVAANSDTLADEVTNVLLDRVSETVRAYDYGKYAAAADLFSQLIQDDLTNQMRSGLDWYIVPEGDHIFTTTVTADVEVETDVDRAVGELGDPITIPALSIKFWSDVPFRLTISGESINWKMGYAKTSISAGRRNRSSHSWENWWGPPGSTPPSTPTP